MISRQRVIKKISFWNWRVTSQAANILQCDLILSVQHWWNHLPTVPVITATCDIITFVVLHKAERQYLLTLQVSRCCLLALHGNIVARFSRRRGEAVAAKSISCCYISPACYRVCATNLVPASVVWCCSDITEVVSALNQRSANAMLAQPPAVAPRREADL